jgi:hypothetical protein
LIFKKRRVPINHRKSTKIENEEKKKLVVIICAGCFFLLLLVWLGIEKIFESWINA